uniref:Uncharacterized protein n=1 Tax=Arundo donax TaxID=35708 RepID=A0A0A9EYR8_ARUDO
MDSFRQTLHIYSDSSSKLQFKKSTFTHFLVFLVNLFNLLNNLGYYTTIATTPSKTQKN